MLTGDSSLPWWPAERFRAPYPILQNYEKPVGSISTARAQLISKGIIYSVKYKELDFTVPEFSGFIQRLDEYQEWLKTEHLIK